MTEQDMSLSEILSDAPIPEAPAAEPTPTPEPVNDGQPRGADGKFAPKANDTTEPTQQPATEHQAGAEPTPPEGFVPHGRFHAVNETAKEQRARADRLEAMLQQALQRVGQPSAPTPSVQEQPKPKDFWENPDEYVQQALTPVQQELVQIRYENSLARAISTYGEDVKTAAETAMAAAINRGELNGETVKAQLQASRDPVGDVIRWHQKNSALQRVGNDPDAWLQAELEKMIADPTKAGELLAKIQQRTTSGHAIIPPNRSTPAPTLPPSLSRLPGGNNTDPGVPTLGDILKGG